MPYDPLRGAAQGCNRRLAALEQLGSARTERAYQSAAQGGYNFGGPYGGIMP